MKTKSRFKPYSPDQQYLFPQDMKQWLPEDDLVYFMVDVVKGLDLNGIYRPYEFERRGQPPCNPTMMVTLLIYAYAIGLPSSRKIEQATYHSIAFRVLTANQHPNHDTISTFRKRYLLLPDFLFKCFACAKRQGWSSLAIFHLMAPK